MFFVIIVALISEYHEVPLLRLWVINPAKPVTSTAVSKVTITMNGIQIIQRSYARVQTWMPCTGIHVLLIPRGTRRERKLKIQRHVQIGNMTRDKVWRGTARTRMRNNHELHGVTRAPRYSAASMRVVSRDENGACIWKTYYEMKLTT